MRSKASFRSHPIHPALIPFPLAFLVGAFGFNAAALLLADPAFARTGGWLTVVGIASALVAAVPGLIDYIYTVPPHSTGKRRATKHLAVNLSAVILFALSLLLRGGVQGETSWLNTLIELAAVALLGAGGWMGGVLVSRNQISVDHRYADAGKWREEHVQGKPGATVRVARADELKTNQLKLLHTERGRIVLGRTESGWVAFDDRCTHRGASLADGVMICGTVQCPWHGSQFDCASGVVRAGPATEAIRTYRVEEREGAAWLTL
ncbi:MAG TPA: DUF2231 domain-containing protein [Longimicrobiales bacterium]|nr:DUF2231 domain-containing protein [Longimicrobiales bacterium]